MRFSHEARGAALATGRTLPSGGVWPPGLLQHAYIHRHGGFRTAMGIHQILWCDRRRRRSDSPMMGCRVCWGQSLPSISRRGLLMVTSGSHPSRQHKEPGLYYFLLSSVGVNNGGDRKSWYIALTMKLNMLTLPCCIAILYSWAVVDGQRPRS